MIALHRKGISVSISPSHRPRTGERVKCVSRRLFKDSKIRTGQKVGTIGGRDSCNMPFIGQLERVNSYVGGS